MRGASEPWGNISDPISVRHMAWYVWSMVTEFSTRAVPLCSINLLELRSEEPAVLGWGSCVASHAMVAGRGQIRCQILSIAMDSNVGGGLFHVKVISWTKSGNMSKMVLTVVSSGKRKNPANHNHFWADEGEGEERCIILQKQQRNDLTTRRRARPLMNHAFFFEHVIVIIVSGQHKLQLASALEALARAWQAPKEAACICPNYERRCQPRFPCCWTQTELGSCWKCGFSRPNWTFRACLHVARSASLWYECLRSLMVQAKLCINFENRIKHFQLHDIWSLDSKFSA